MSQHYEDISSNDLHSTRSSPESSAERGGPDIIHHVNKESSTAIYARPRIHRPQSQPATASKISLTIEENDLYSSVRGDEEAGEFRY